MGCYFIRNKAGGIRGNREASGQSCWNYFEISVFGGAQGQPGDGERCTQMLLGCRSIYHADSYAALFDTSFTPGWAGGAGLQIKTIIDCWEQICLFHDDAEPAERTCGRSTDRKNTENRTKVP